MKHFQVESEGPVQIWSMSNPPMNYMTAAMSEELLELVGRAESDENVRAIVLTGGIEGKFITHYSVEELAAAAADPAECARTFPELEAGFHRMLDRITLMPKVVIAAINGDCMGGGYELALVRFSARRRWSISNRIARSRPRDPARRWRYPAIAAPHRERARARGDVVRQRLSSTRRRAVGHG